MYSGFTVLDDLSKNVVFGYRVKSQLTVMY